MAGPDLAVGVAAGRDDGLPEESVAEWTLVISGVDRLAGYAPVGLPVGQHTPQEPRLLTPQLLHRVQLGLFLVHRAGVLDQLRHNLERMQEGFLQHLLSCKAR